MPFSIRPYRRFPLQCAVTYNAGPFQGHGTVWNLSWTESKKVEGTIFFLQVSATTSFPRSQNQFSQGS
jgi:hypothetical protein